MKRTCVVVVSPQHGATDFVLKPFETPDGLIGVVDQSVERWHRWFDVLRKTASLNQKE